jgi:putative NIF3 family GTP cyclohydrolase 1 type 2
MTLETTNKSLVDVKTYLDTLLQVEGLDESSNGLVIGGRPEISRVALSVNCSWQAIEGALERNCELLLTHHAAWPSTDAFLVDKKHSRLRQAGVNLYVAHECLDRAEGFGTAHALARATRVVVQGTIGDREGNDLGVHGLTTGHLSEFAVRVGQQLGMEPRVWKNSDSFGHVAVVPGWGGRPEWMAEAHSLGCDTVLTGEALMFGQLFAKEAGINLVLGGHYATEAPGIMALSARIARDLSLDVTFIPETIVEDRG